MLKLSIIIPIFNGLDYTKKCLKSLSEDTDIGEDNIDFSIVIVDDSSSDGSFEWIEKNYPYVHLLRGNGDLWWSGGINLGVKYAIENLNTDYIIWWNNDIISGKMYFRNLVEIIKGTTENTILGSKIYLANNKNIIWSMGGMFDSESGQKSMVGSDMEDNDSYQKEIEVDWLPGMGTITHKSVYQKVGMLDDKNFPQYHGDSDFTFRAKLKGFRIIVNPLLKIYNDNSNSGITHSLSFKGLTQSLFSIKSNYNIIKDIKFYKRHTNSYKAYLILFVRYFKYIGGFFKWKLFYFFGVKK